MEEILTLKELLLKGDIPGSLAIVEELEEMGRKDIVKTIRSYSIVLLINLIKRQVEKRTTRSWDVSIQNAIFEIRDENKRPCSQSYYLSPEELDEVLEVAYKQAINKASLEVSEGIYEAKELEKLANKEEILNQAIELIKDK
ncbi:DUF29 domain-containing protein [Planktothrix agardhii 1806]|uniref:Uncharacterized protein n=2 Tax=Planktothrix agardhii TaxID=1160 RepID=A0A073CHW3_PLAA1|nr:DUF29 family protein [Planktothrix agardhii]KEI67706.1 hypothetical protein A19Y_2840 [Planktothrix agardhii NIVA-CYA 126/8]MCB8759470.1 DUF29 domain-containing protein [Planktothrix agardhii 1813]MCB8764780.1 DUF29 domain-containing protein [Planktothrix agardhii 1809]MCB8778419.1 DUF29 domain-containing protein [Planktothrix agardhii 1031]MCB8782837.1 DUF29 domain-containing protein [Planktothrix agardhii 1808]